MLEIERRFLARIHPDADLPAPSRISQGYLTLAEPSVRIRCREGEWTLAVKTGRGVVRREVEIHVDAASGEELMKIAGEFRVDKVRYEMERWEIDVFDGYLRGLVLAEIELETEDEPLPTAPRGVELIREVTTEITSRWLAGLAPDIAPRVVREVYGAAG